MAQVIDAEDNNCSLRGFERNRYFFGKPMMVRDFDAEQQYFNGKRYLLNRLIHGRGVVCGLGVTANEAGGFTLKAGAAIDCCGREIVVGADYAKTDLTELEGYRDELVTKTVYLCLVYDECIREPVHTQANASSCADVCDYNRVREGFKVVIKTTAPAAAPDFCEAATSKKTVLTVSDEGRFVLERVAPLWVNPKDVFEVRLTATPKSVTGTLAFDVEELFSPAGQLTVVQGIPVTQRVSFSLTQGGGPVQKSYLLRAGETPGRTEIKANVYFPPSTTTKAEAQGTAVEISAQKLSGLLAGKVFRDENLGACPSCKDDDHCVYLASAKLGANSQLTELNLFPSDQYVYNNPLLFELLACGEHRIGKIPEIPVFRGNETTPVVSAVTAFRFSQGLTAADGGLGQANVTAKVDKGLRIDGDSVVADLGKGVMLDAATDQISADLGGGLLFDGNHIKADLGRGLAFDGSHISADLGNGLVFDGNHIAARAGQGVKLSGNLIAADLGDGLKLDAANRITANPGSGINVVGQKIVAEVGSGLKFVANQIQADYSAPNVSEAGKVCQANDPRLSDARVPVRHAPTHQDGGADEINVTGLSGVLQDAQRVVVLDEGTAVATRTRLNFVGAGVTVTDEGDALNRVKISIAGRVSTGLVRFMDMQPGEIRSSEKINHQQGSNPCAIVLALVSSEATASVESDLFGYSEILNDFPVLVASNNTGEQKFVITVRDRRRTQNAVVYTIRWWAIPRDTEASLVTVSAPPGVSAGISTPTEEMVRLTTVINPNSTREQLASSLGVDATVIDTHLNSLQNAGRISIVGNKIIPK